MYLFHNGLSTQNKPEKIPRVFTFTQRAKKKRKELLLYVFIIIVVVVLLLLLSSFCLQPPLLQNFTVVCIKKKLRQHFFSLFRTKKTG